MVRDRELEMVGKGAVVVVVLGVVRSEVGGNEMRGVRVSVVVPRWMARRMVGRIGLIGIVILLTCK